MSFKGDSSGFNYAEIASKARTVPEVTEDGPSNIVELAAVFKPPVEWPDSKGQHPYIQTDIPEEKVAPEILFTASSKVFILWRPWERCRRCQQAIDSGHTVLPEIGDYTCPHVENAEYKAVIDKGLRGDAVLTLKEAFNMQDGSRCVHVEWMEPDPVRKKEIEKMMEERKKNRVWPPDVEGFMNPKR